MNMKINTPCLPTGMFAPDAETIAATFASKDTYPEGPAAGIRLLGFYLAHAGKRLSVARRRNVEKARQLLSVQVEQAMKREPKRAA